MLTMIDSLSNDGQLLVGMFTELIKVKEKFDNQQENWKIYIRLLGNSDRLYVGIQHIKEYTESLGYIYITNLNTPKIEAFIEKIIEKLKNYGYTV